jgi:AIPR protein/Abortive infection phage resistance protein N-terminal domain
LHPNLIDARQDLFVTSYYGTGKIIEIGNPETRRQFELLGGFLKRSLAAVHTRMEESSRVFRVAQKIHAASDEMTTVRLFLLTDGKVRSLEIEQAAFGDLDIRYVVWDIEKLSRLRAGRGGVIELDFLNDYGGSIPCLQTADAVGEYRTFLAYFPAPLLARIYGELGQRLLERNVRAYLQAKGKVNRGLQKTLKDEPHRFLAYNNGLCCTASEIQVKAGQDGHARIESVKDFQIVNGGQTTASIHHALKKGKLDIGRVTVQVKITVLADPSKMLEMVPLISLYANSQNKVNTADLSANGPFHRALEQLSRTSWAPPLSGLERGTHWFYERERGSYSDDKSRQGTPKEQREWQTQNPIGQKFTKTDLAKFEHAWQGKPHLVCLGGEKNFTIFAETLAEDNESASVDAGYLKHLVAKAILFRTAERLFTVQKLKDYRANSVAYAVAWLAVGSGWRIDLDRIWNEQRLTPALCDALKIAFSAAHEHISSQQGNQNEASNRESCWEEFKGQKLPVADAWLKELATEPFSSGQSEEDKLARQWESIRLPFVSDLRTLEEIEAITGKSWVAARREDQVRAYADRSWEQLRSLRGMGLKKLRILVEMLAAARPGA